jgi:superfamily II RNA helicase
MKRPYPKPYKRSSDHRRRRGSAYRTDRIQPSADGRLKKVFQRIGVPEHKTFTPDAFQIEAISAVADTDCLVSAPTGSGKTWIAQEAIRRVFMSGGRAWYASPLKALTNSKLLEFGSEFGPSHVGILTGDRKENADAQIIVGTTEILRNQLYDAMHEGKDVETDLVILDEAHFLGDPDRGVVWEEIMIYLPPRIHLLLLSATIGNASQISGWLESIRSKQCVIVEETRRPVPLFPLFFHPTGRLLPLLSGERLDKQVRRFLNSSRPRAVARPGGLPPFGEVLRVLRRFDLLPAIFFMKSRADCDAALSLCDTEGAHPKKGLNEAVDRLVGDSEYLKGHRQIGYLHNRAVAAHHSGQLPAWKLLVEELMTEGWLDAVFATSTVAAGVNFPARSVIFLNSDRYNGYGFVPLSGTEFHQATGRAGRRGKDHIGFAVVVPGKYMDVDLMAELYVSPPGDVISQIRMDFSMALNLLLSHSPEEIKGIFHRSFAVYLEIANREQGLEQQCREAGRRLMAYLPEALCEGPEEALALARRKKALIWESKALGRELKKRKREISKWAYLEPGRLFRDRQGRLYCIVKREANSGQGAVLAVKVKKKPSVRRHRLRLRRFVLQKVGQILDHVVSLPDPKDPEQVQRVVAREARRRLREVVEPAPVKESDEAELDALRARLVSRQAEMDALVCSECRHRSLCHGRGRESFQEARDDFSILWDRMDAVRARLWKDFLRHLAFLKEEGFVNDAGQLTDDGHWASRLRLDQPLLVAQALRRKALPRTNPRLLAALVAPFALDRDVDTRINESRLSATLLTTYRRLGKQLEGIVKRKAAKGFEVKPMSLWASASVYAWAGGQSWGGLLELTETPEGDLAMLMMRTAENLRQIASLREAFPHISRSAWQAIELILRAPVAGSE